MVLRLALFALLAASSWSLPTYAHEGVNIEIAALGIKIQKEPQNVALYLERAALLRRERQFAGALADLATAQKLAPDRREITLEKGLTLAGMGQTKEAETLLSAYLDSGLPSVSASLARGKIREQAKRYAEARADYAAAVTLSPTPDSFLARGRMDEALSHWDDAATGYEEGLRVLSGAVVLRLALIRVEHKRGHYDRAITLVDEILPQLSFKAEWLLLRAEQHAAAARPEKARKDREDALRETDERLARRPTDLVRILRVKALEALGRNKEALQEIEMIVQHAPNLEDARILRDRIRQATISKR